MNSDEFDLETLRGGKVPAPDPQARRDAMDAAMHAFDEAAEKNRAGAQGSAAGNRLTDRAIELWREIMQKKLVAAPALAGLAALPIAGYVGWQFINDWQAPAGLGAVLTETRAPARLPVEQEAVERGVSDMLAPQAAMPPPVAVAPIAGAARDMSAGNAKMVAPAPERYPPVAQENRDRFENFDTNPIRAVLDDPVSTFSIDVDTASYAFARRALKSGSMPDPDSVRVEEMINYFPYDWPAPQSAGTPFETTITVTPTPWNEHTQLMHIGIKGYEVEGAQRPRANLVFLIDSSGSMEAEDKLPLLKNSFRLLLDGLDPQDTVSIVTYAGDAGTVLEPTPASERGEILSAIDGLAAGGRTAGEAGIEQAYRLAEESFIEGGINRVILATDGDFNIGATSDEDLKRLVEKKRESGVFLSVLGFGRGNLNDRLMQTLAQNGNGTASYIDTLAEAEKVLSEEASSTLFPIAKDVKIQVEFNPQKISEYRLIGYETRALAREDFNNDRVDAGEIGSGHTVTAIYEITPEGSPAEMIDDLRYGAPAADGDGADADEYAFVKIRYKAPDAEESRLITTPVTEADRVASLAAAGDDVRFSIAVAGFGQKLRGADAVAGMDYGEIMEIATSARGADPFGYRAEFLSLVRLASALDR